MNIISLEAKNQLETLIYRYRFLLNYIVIGFSSVILELLVFNFFHYIIKLWHFF